MHWPPVRITPTTCATESQRSGCRAALRSAGHPRHPGCLRSAAATHEASAATTATSVWKSRRAGVFRHPHVKGSATPVRCGKPPQSADQGARHARRAQRVRGTDHARHHVNVTLLFQSRRPRRCSMPTSAASPRVRMPVPTCAAARLWRPVLSRVDTLVDTQLNSIGTRKRCRCAARPRWRWPGSLIRAI